MHGWNDDIKVWRCIEDGLSAVLDQKVCGSAWHNGRSNRGQVFLYTYASLDNESRVDELAEVLRLFIEERISPRDEINIVCYSTGALITRTLLVPFATFSPSSCSLT